MKRLNIKYRLESNVDIYLSLENNLFFKIYKDYGLINLIERNILFLQKENLSRPKITELIYKDNKFVGYSQEYISDSKTFFDGIDDPNISIEIKHKAISDVFSMIRALHSKNVVIGDVHSRNMLYNEDGGFLIDLDEIRLDTEENYHFSELYYIHHRINDDCLVASKNTDNIKATISALSLLYGFDFEEIAMMHSISTVVAYLELFIGDNNLLEDLKEIFYNTSNDILYFDEILKKYYSGNEFIKI